MNALELIDLCVTGPGGPIVTRADLAVEPGQTVASWANPAPASR
jgi:hypothetical protein